MGKELSQKEIGARIALLRKHQGLSQEELAKFLSVSRSSLVQMEAGRRGVSAVELIRLSHALNISLDKLLAMDFTVIQNKELILSQEAAQPVFRNPVPVLKIEKFVNILLYILERCAGKPNVGETVLYKLLYFADFNFYENYEEHLTGVAYRKLDFGPVPLNFGDVLAQMIEKQKIQRVKTEYFGFTQTRYLPLEKPDLTLLNAAEKETIDRVIEQYSDWSASAISEYSHKDIPWLATDEGELIDYELAFYREPPYSARVYEEEQEERS